LQGMLEGDWGIGGLERKRGSLKVVATTKGRRRLTTARPIDNVPLEAVPGLLAMGREG